jgi:hypothetical protein
MRKAHVKDILTVVTFVVVALCFMAFLTTVKPEGHGAVTAPGKPVHCKFAAFWCVRTP